MCFVNGFYHTVRSLSACYPLTSRLLWLLLFGSIPPFLPLCRRTSPRLQCSLTGFFSQIVGGRIAFSLSHYPFRTTLLVIKTFRGLGCPSVAACSRYRLSSAVTVGRLSPIHGLLAFPGTNRFSTLSLSGTRTLTDRLFGRPRPSGPLGRPVSRRPHLLELQRLPVARYLVLSPRRCCAGEEGGGPGRSPGRGRIVRSESRRVGQEWRLE